MVKQIYACKVCSRTFERREEAEKHEQMPVQDPFPIGLILKWKNQPRGFEAEYGIITSKCKPHPLMHEMIYKFYSFSLGKDFQCLSDYTALDIQGKLRSDSLSELTEEEFRTLNIQWEPLILSKVGLEKELTRTYYR